VKGVYNKKASFSCRICTGPPYSSKKKSYILLTHKTGASSP